MLTLSNFGFVDRWACTEMTQDDKTGAVAGHLCVIFCEMDARLVRADL